MVTSMITLLVLSIITSVFFVVKKMWKQFGICIAIIFASFTGIGIASPVSPNASNSFSTHVPAVQTEPKVEIKQIQEHGTATFATTEINDPSLAKGTTNVTQEGEAGENTITYEVVYKKVLNKVESKSQVV